MRVKLPFWYAVFGDFKVIRSTQKDDMLYAKKSRLFGTHTKRCLALKCAFLTI